MPPLEGFWWQNNVEGVDYSNKDTFNWISVIRLPDFVTKADFDWAVKQLQKRRKWIVPVRSFLLWKKGFVFRLCI